MSGTRETANEINDKLIVEIVERNKGRACFELFGIIPNGCTGTIKRTFLYKGKKYLVTLRDITDDKKEN